MLCCVIRHPSVSDYIHVICNKSNVVTGSIWWVTLGYRGDFTLVVSGTAVSYRFLLGHGFTWSCWVPQIPSPELPRSPAGVCQGNDETSVLHSLLVYLFMGSSHG